MSERLPGFIRKVGRPRGWAYGLFWSWNLIFLAFMLLGFAPQLLPEMMTAVRAGEIPAVFPLYAAILTAIPVGAVILGLTLLRRSPGRLLALGYGVEGPVMILLALRFFVVREMTPGVAVLLLMAGLGMMTFLWQLLDRNIDRQGPLAAYGRMIGLTLLLLTGLYASLWFAFYALPIAIIGWEGVGRSLESLWDWLAGFQWQELGDVPWGRAPFIVLGTILLMYTATLLIGMPVAVVLLYIRAWRRGLRALMVGVGRLQAAGVIVPVLVIALGLFFWSNRQPQQQVFAMLDNPPASPAEARSLLEQQELIRAGLLNAYLAPQRYFSVVGEVRHVRAMYEHTLDFPQEQAERVQRLYEMVARPVLYAPVTPTNIDSNWDNSALRREPREAAGLYEQFFDQPIIEGERGAIIHAVRSTWSIEQARTAWQAIDDREIYLVRQEVTVAERGDWADIELYEVYQNRTAQPQEVVYYFSLPESAVITGVWLGHSPNPEDRFAYRVAPRGAAQAVYRNEVRYVRDPALVEQIGPRQYRLRVFPVEPQRAARDRDTERSFVREGPPLHMWLTWRVLAKDNTWPLPRLAEKRNVYWDDASVRLINDRPMSAGEETWLPISIPTTVPVQPALHEADFPGGWQVRAEPVTAGALPELPADLHLAVVLDRSRSMFSQAEAVQAALAQLARVTDSGAAADVYLTASTFRGEAPSRVNLADLDPDEIVYYGGQNAAELLVQFDALQGDRTYDAIFVLTDDSGYELKAEEVEAPSPDAPVWLVHLDGRFPLGYDDDTLEAIQASGGGVAGSVEEGLTRLAASLADGQQAAVDVIDGYVWTTDFSGLTAAESGYALMSAGREDGFTALAARQVILAEMRRQRGWLKQLEALDKLHAIAVEAGIVTPYSSMIVLVDAQQKQLHDRLENRADRFRREYEDVGETLHDNPFTVTGVPEPEEWLLIGLAASMLGWYLHTKRLRLGHKA